MSPRANSLPELVAAMRICAAAENALFRHEPSPVPGPLYEWAKACRRARAHRRLIAQLVDAGMAERPEGVAFIRVLAGDAIEAEARMAELAPAGRPEGLGDFLP